MQASDRRRADRLRLRIPMRLHVWKSTVPDQKVESVNLSRSGVCFTTDVLLHRGEVVELILDMPEELSGELVTEWRCTGHVVYVQPPAPPRGALGVGVQFDCYEVAQRIGPQSMGSCLSGQENRRPRAQGVLYFGTE